MRQWLEMKLCSLLMQLSELFLVASKLATLALCVMFDNAYRTKHVDCEHFP